MRPTLPSAESNQSKAQLEQVQTAPADVSIEIASSLPGWDLLPPQGLVIRRKRVGGE